MGPGGRTAPPPASAVGAAPVGTGRAPGVPGQGQRRIEQDGADLEPGQADGGGSGIPGFPNVDMASWNWEWLVGGNWLARIGIVALILGVAFFISLAIDRGWLGETERVLLGVAGGLALLAAGGVLAEALRRMGPDRGGRRAGHPLRVGLRGLWPVRADRAADGLWGVFAHHLSGGPLSH